MATLLGEQSFFLGTPRPTTLDCTLYAFLASVVRTHNSPWTNRDILVWIERLQSVCIDAQAGSVWRALLNGAVLLVAVLCMLVCGLVAGWCMVHVLSDPSAPAVQAQPAVLPEPHAGPAVPQDRHQQRHQQQQPHHHMTPVTPIGHKEPRPHSPGRRMGQG